jgi:hypothetical protein
MKLKVFEYKLFDLTFFKFSYRIRDQNSIVFCPTKNIIPHNVLRIFTTCKEVPQILAKNLQPIDFKRLK